MLDKGINGFMSERLVVILVRMFLHVFIYGWVYLGTVLGTGFVMVDLGILLLVVPCVMNYIITFLQVMLLYWIL